MNARVAAERLVNHRLAGPAPRDAARVVEWLGAVQAQDYYAALWGIGVRMPDGSTAAAVERAADDGRILRTHVMRPTWHFVPAADVHWMLELTAPRVRQALAFAHRHYGLDAGTRARAARVVERSLRNGDHLTRSELAADLRRGGIALEGPALAILIIDVELEGVICSGRRRGKEGTYALLAARAPRPTRLSREEALARLAGRYFRSHGPATLRDFAWWSGLKTADARRGLDAAGAQPETIDGLTYWRIGRGSRTRRAPVSLLPVFDEYLVAYRDLAAVPRGKTIGGGMLPQAVVIDGQVAATWRRQTRGNAVVVDVASLRPVTAPEQRAVAAAAARYGRFLKAPVSVHFA